MPELPTITAARLIRALQRDGFFIHHTTGSHHVFKHPDLPRLAREVAVVVEELGGVLLRRILPPGLGDAEFAIVAQRLAVGDGVVPDKPRG